MSDDDKLASDLRERLKSIDEQLSNDDIDDDERDELTTQRHVVEQMIAIMEENF